MVSYQEWFAVVQETASSKSRGDLEAERRGNLTEDLAQYWQKNKSELQAMSKREAKQLAEKIVEV